MIKGSSVAFAGAWNKPRRSSSPTAVRDPYLDLFSLTSSIDTNSWLKSFKNPFEASNSVVNLG